MAITIGNQQLKLADDYAEALDKIGDRATANTRKALIRAIKATLRDLRRWYADAIDPTQPAEVSADGVTRRPRSYSIAESSRKLTELNRIAQRFLSPAELQALQTVYETDLAEAAVLGDDLGRELLQTVSPEAQARAPFVGPQKVAMKAAAATTSAYIRAEVESFRDRLTQIVTAGVGRGQGYRAIEGDVRRALLGASDPNGITKRLGLMQRAELIARSELANAYVGAQKLAAQRNGALYGRWIATKDERTCRVCASRHGRVYLLSEMVGTQHPRCRCSIAPVPTEHVEEKDPALRAQLLRQDYWDQSREAMVRAFAAEQGWPFDRASKVLEDAVLKPSPSERRQFPDIEVAPVPVA